ncbi:MAG: XRE family transcriptional regulator [Flavobacteriaceae bacterium]|nr:XRE family transcriptional regulator [Flavobacteriaceae bacterium]
MEKYSLDAFGIRLKSARKIAGLSLQELSNKMSNEVTKQSLSKYEKGLMKPSPKVLLLLSRSLSVNPDFFLKSNIVNFKAISFRKRTSLSKKEEESILEKAKKYYENYLEIENILGIKNDFINPLEKLKINDFSDLDEAAKQLRDFWNLGTQPISNIIEMLESNGIKVFLIDDNEKIDGIASLIKNGSPLIIVNKGDKPLERIRFTIIHELAHVLLKFNSNIKVNSKLIEKMCHYFASCFLIPGEVLIKMIGGKRRYIKIEELITIKNYFGISLRAIIYRLKQIGVITENYHRRWSIWLSKTYGAKYEPGNYIGVEGPYRFIQLINRALSEELISISKAASLSNVPIHKFKKIEPIV